MKAYIINLKDVYKRQVLEYVKDGIRQGKEQKQLASELARKGVTKERLFSSSCVTCFCSELMAVIIPIFIIQLYLWLQMYAFYQSISCLLYTSLGEYAGWISRIHYHKDNSEQCQRQRLLCFNGNSKSGGNG